MNESKATADLAISVRNAVQRRFSGIDPDALYEAIHDSLVDNWEQFIEAATLAFVQREIYEQLKQRFERDT